MGRRRARLAVGGAVLAATLAACSSTSGTTSATSSTTTAGATAATAAPSAATQGPDPAPAAASSDVRTWRAPDGTRVQYVLVVPPGRPAGAPGKVLLTFPPGSQDLDLTERIVDDRWRTEALARGWVVVSPAAAGKGLWYEPDAAALVPGLLDEVARTYPADGGRFDLAGVSNGGLSAFAAAQAHPERFRSLVVFPGMPPGGNDPAALARLKGLGAAFFVGALDRGWLEGSHRAADALRALGNTVEVHDVPGQDHVITTLTGKDLFDAMERVRGR